MTIEEFVGSLAAELKISREKAQEVYRGFTAALRSALSQGEEVRLEQLGKFASVLRNPAANRPHREAQSSGRVIEVSFTQFRSSKTELYESCPFREELTDGKDPPCPAYGRSANVRDEPD